MSDSAPKRPGLHRISDRKRLGRLIDRLVAECGNGSQRKAAEFIRLGHATISRLRSGRLGEISHKTAAELERAARFCCGSQEGSRLLTACIVSPHAEHYYRLAQVRWCTERMYRFERRSGGHWQLHGQRPGSEVDLPKRSGDRKNARRARHRALNKLLERARAEHPDVVERFERRIQTRNMPPQRVLIAHVRVVEPLAETTESGYIEAGWDELTPDDRARFLAAGYEREEILLRREHDFERAERIANGNAPWLTAPARV